MDTERVNHLGDATRKAAGRPGDGLDALRGEDIADAIGYIVTRDRRMAVNEMVVRAGEQTW